MPRRAALYAAAVLVLLAVFVVFKTRSGCSVDFPSGYESILPPAQSSGKRIYLYPGLDASVSVWDAGPLGDLVKMFGRVGHHVVLLGIPKPQACFFDGDGGLRYRQAFDAALSSALREMEGKHGPAKISIVGGASFGGLHALQASTSGKFTAWFAHLPVVRIDALAEFPKVGDVPHFSAEDLGKKISGSGLLTYGTADERVNWRLTQRLAEEIKRPLTVLRYEGQAHETLPKNVEDIAAWVNAVK